MQYSGHCDFAYQLLTLPLCSAPGYAAYCAFYTMSFGLDIGWIEDPNWERGLRGFDLLSLTRTK
jgi:hypothetical protein